MLQLEHEYHPIDYRNLCELRRVSFVARAVYLELFCGNDRTKHGVVQVRLATLEDESGIDRAAIVAAVDELHANGLIVYDKANRLAYHVGHALRHAYNEKLRIGWSRVRDGLPSGPARDAFAAELSGIAYATDTVSVRSAYGKHTVSIPSGKDTENGNGNGNGNGNENQNGNKTAIAVSAPAFAGDPQPVFAPKQPAPAAPTGWGFDPTFRSEAPVPIPVKLPPEPIPPEPPAEEPPDDFPEVDWSTIPRTVPDLLPDELDVAPVPKLTEAAKARLQAAQAELRLTPPKPERKPLTPAQLDAIFARDQLRIAVDMWNEALGKTTCGPADFVAIKKLAGTLMANLSKFVHQHGETPAVMVGWAAERSEYHGGKGSRSWTFQQWFTADHLAAVYADYRKDRGDQRLIHYDPERNLRAWRLETEERAKCIAEGRIYGAVFEPMPEVA